MTAQDLYRAFITERIGPALRSRGFRGSSGTYERPDDAHWVLLGLQKSVYSDRDGVRFTLNVTVASKEAWGRERVNRRPYLPAKPAPTVRYGNFIWQQRIGMLMNRNDTWWTLDHETDLGRLESEVLGAIDTAAIPAIADALRVE